MSPREKGTPLRDAILVELTTQDGEVGAVSVALAETLAAVGRPASDLALYRAVEGEQVTAYLPAEVCGVAFDNFRALISDVLCGHTNGSVEICRLKTKLAIAGASAGAEAPYRYVVRTDVAIGGETELENWYDVEHMPSLAAVPGAVFAQRMLCMDAPPLYYACYDLTGPEVLRSGPWLDVRATEWSGRVRPTFRDTRRILSRRVDRVAP
jgi:hypothetical protein